MIWDAAATSRSRSSMTASSKRFGAWDCSCRSSKCLAKTRKRETPMTNVMPPKTRATVLIVEDDPGIAELERDRLSDVGYNVLLAATAEEALGQLGAQLVDLILLDYRLPDVADGLEFYARLKTAGHDVPVILVTGFGNEATVIRSLRAGVRDFITK